MTKDWETRAREKREAILAAIPQEWRIENPPNDKQIDVTGPFIQQFLSEREVEITEKAVEEILEQTIKGQWKAEEVARAFCHRAALAHQLTNCLHEIFFDAAIADAKALDNYFAEHNKPKGPLHGLPISLKDQFHVKGVETSMGYVGWLGTFEGRTGTGKEKVFESEIVRSLRASGAILYVKTAVPHTLMSGESINNIIGYVWNPKNRNLAAGGSSGGEGALIGCRGSVIGFGTDIGGSIRIPAAFNGLYGIRPSTGRLPYEGMANSMDGQNTILSVVGPLGTSVEGLRIVTKALLEKKPWFHDPLVHEIPWREEKNQEIYNRISGNSNEGKLVFAVMKTDGIVRPLPPVARAINTVVDALRSHGHEVIDWTPPNQKQLLDEGFKSWVFDGGADVKAAFALSGEPMSDQVSFYSNLSKHYTASEIASVNVRIRELRKEFLEYWNSTEKITSAGRVVDALICPLAPFPAARPGLYKYYGYSTWVNVVDWTSVVLPVTEVDKDKDGRRDGVEEGWEPGDETEKSVWDSYDPDIYHGAHVSLQIVGRRLQEEKMLAVAEYVGKVIGK